MNELEEIKYTGNGKRYETFPTTVYCPHCKKWFVLNLHIDKELGGFDITHGGEKWVTKKDTKK